MKQSPSDLHFPLKPYPGGRLSEVPGGKKTLEVRDVERTLQVGVLDQALQCQKRSLSEMCFHELFSFQCSVCTSTGITIPLSLDTVWGGALPPGLLTEHSETE